MHRIRSVVGWLRRRPVWADAAFALAVGYADCVAVATYSERAAHGSMHVPLPVAFGFVLAAALPLALRRAAPVTVLVLVAALHTFLSA